MKCFGCEAGCVKCDAKNESKCLFCEDPLLNFDGSCLTDCPTGWRLSVDETYCRRITDENIIYFFGKEIKLPLIYFPHLIAALLIAVIAIGGYLKDRKSYVPTNMLVFLGPLTFISFIVQCFFAYQQSTRLLFLIMVLAILVKIATNIAFYIYYRIGMKKDEEFATWVEGFKRSSKVIACLGCCCSFKVFKLFYSNFYGHETFKATFENAKKFRIVMIVF